MLPEVNLIHRPIFQVLAPCPPAAFCLPASFLRHLPRRSQIWAYAGESRAAGSSARTGGLPYSRRIGPSPKPATPFYPASFPSARNRSPAVPPPPRSLASAARSRAAAVPPAPPPPWLQALPLQSDRSPATFRGSPSSSSDTRPQPIPCPITLTPLTLASHRLLRTTHHLAHSEHNYLRPHGRQPHHPPYISHSIWNSLYCFCFSLYATRRSSPMPHYLPIAPLRLPLFPQALCKPVCTISHIDLLNHHMELYHEPKA